MDSVSEGVAIAAIGLAVVETAKIYCNTAPSLRELRLASPGDFETRQLVLDADMLGLIVVLALGGGGAALTRKWYPLLLAAGTLLLLSAYYRAVINSSNEGMSNE
jgi:hypothetical protein